MFRRFIVDQNYRFTPRKYTQLKTLIPLPKSPKISIVMPSFNQGHFIAESIRSVLNQDYENLELIIVDGESSDDTLDVIHQYSKKDDRIRLLSESDNGPLNALHKGFRLCTGHIIGMQPSSDYYLPGTFSQVIQEYQANSKLFAIGGILAEIDAHGNKGSRCTAHKYTERRQLNINEVLLWQQPAGQSGFFRREAFFAYGGFDERFVSCHTVFFYHFMLEGLGLGGEIWEVPKVWGVFRRHENADHIKRQMNAHEIYMERLISRQHAVDIFKDVLTDKQLEDIKQAVLTKSILALKTIEDNVTEWLKTGQIQTALEFYDSHKHCILESTWDAEQFHTTMEYLRTAESNPTIDVAVDGNEIVFNVKQT